MPLPDDLKQIPTVRNGNWIERNSIKISEDIKFTGDTNLLISVSVLIDTLIKKAVFRLKKEMEKRRIGGKKKWFKKCSTANGDMMLINYFTKNR